MLDALRPMKVHIDCGAADPFADATRELIRRLPVPPSGGISEGCHDPGYWLRAAPGQVDVLAGALT